MFSNPLFRAAIAATFAVLATEAVSHAAHDDRRKDRVERPDVPSSLEVDKAFRPFLSLHAEGTQNYICLATATGQAWTFIGPQATLYDDALDQVTTHYLSPNPQEAGLARATWRHSRDTSTVWAAAIATSADPAYVAPGAIPWLTLKVVGAQYGPGYGRRLTATRFIQRVNTVGGTAPATGCAAATDIGKRAFAPYTTDYVFYR